MELLKKDNNNSIRVATIYCYKYEGWAAIKRTTGLLNGTMTAQPDIEIYAGKANRSIEEQSELEYNSMLSDYLDKGYKPLSAFGIKHLSELTQVIINNILKDRVVDTNGAPKPMLAKLAYERTDPRFKRRQYASSKIDGVRCTLRYDQQTRSILTASRGGKAFQYSTAHITKDPVLLRIFAEDPNLILDGELYIHGKPLQFIQGLAKMKYYVADVHDELDFYIFDIVEDTPFDLRYEKLLALSAHISGLAFLMDSMDTLEHIRFVEHTETFSYSDVMGLHGEAIKDGYEGLILRDPHSTYGFGARDWRMIKIKMFDDDEFTIIGMSEGLRTEDMVFRLLAPNGKTFEAKPVGIRAVREQYADNIEAYIGQKGCVKYFGYTPGGIPNLPIFKYVRELR